MISAGNQAFITKKVILLRDGNQANRFGKTHVLFSHEIQNNQGNVQYIKHKLAACTSEALEHSKNHM